MFENIFNHADLKKAYRDAARKAHPDMGGSTEEMQRVNADFEKATKRINRTGERFSTDERTADHADDFRSASADDIAKYMQILKNLILFDDIEIELVGTWIWVSGNTYAHKDAIKAAVLRWSNKHKAWYWHNPEEKCCRGRKGDTLDDIKERHGCKAVKAKKPEKLTA